MRNSKLGNTSSGQWATGGQIGGYTVLGTIGAGGMGQVFHARDPTGRDVAIKTIAGADAELVLRFQREAEALATVDTHPAVVRIHSAGTHGGRPYLVMDYLEGGSLYDRLEEGPLPPREAAWVVRELAHGLAHVHRHGILHRDLKPQNVLLDEDSGPHLADFGLARIQGADALTRSGSMLGTIGYMAPEQALGLTDDIDARTDIYGLGGILFHALTGRPPFVGKPHEVVKAVVESEPPSARALVPSVPAALDAICRHALARRQADRPRNAEALAEELDAFLDAPEGSDAAGGVQPHLPLLLTLACVALMLSLGLAAVLVARKRAQGTTPAPSLAHSPAPTPSVDPEPTLAPSPSPTTEPTPRVDPAAHPPADCLRLALKLHRKRGREQADLVDAEAFLLEATAQEEPGAHLHLGLIQLELGHDAAGVDTLWADFEAVPVLPDARSDRLQELRLTARLALVLALLEGRLGGATDVRRGFGVLEGVGRDMHSVFMTTGEPLELDEERLRLVAGRDDTLPVLLQLLVSPGKMGLHSEQAEELSDLADDLAEEDQDPSAPLRLLEVLAEDGMPDPFAWYHLAEYYEQDDRGRPRSLELYLRVIDVEGFPSIRNESRREAAEALMYGEDEGVPQDLERAKALLDGRALNENKDAPRTLRKIEKKLAEQASGDR